MHLINLPPNPRQLLREINLIAQKPPGLLVRPQRVQSRVDDARVGFLIVENRQRASGHDGREDGQGAHPAVGRGEGGEVAVGAALHEGPGVGFGGSDEGASLRWSGVLEDLPEERRPEARAGEHCPGEWGLLECECCFSREEYREIEMDIGDARLGSLARFEGRGGRRVLIT